MRATHTIALVVIACAVLAVGMGHISRTWAASIPLYAEKISSFAEQQISPVSLPSMAVLFGSAVLGLIAVARQKRASGRRPPPP